MTTPSTTPARHPSRTLAVAGVTLVAIVVGAAGVQAAAAPAAGDDPVPTVTSPPTTSTTTTLPMLTVNPSGPADVTETAGTLVAVTLSPPVTLPTLELIDDSDVDDLDDLVVDRRAYPPRPGRCRPQSWSSGRGSACGRSATSHA